MFEDLERTCDTTDRHGMRQMLRVYGVIKIVEAVPSLYVDIRAFVRV